MILLVAFYKVFMAGICGMGGCCRFYPSCSEYALLVYKSQSFGKATTLIFKRLLDCRPWGPKFRYEPELNCEKGCKNVASGRFSL